MKRKLKPLGGHVVVKPVEKTELTPAGILIPETAKEKPDEGVIVAVGNGKRDGGKKVPIEVKPGDRVLLGKYGGTVVKLEEKTYRILDADDILALVGEPRT
jgi:chaperonin GroES